MIDNDFKRSTGAKPARAGLKLSPIETKRRRVVIIGAGIIGLATAYYCRQRGWDVTVVERQSAQRGGCSFGNAGMVVPSHFIPLAAPGMVARGLKWLGNADSPFFIKPRPSPELLDWLWKFWRASTRERVERAAPLLRDLSFASRVMYEELSALPGHDFGLTKNGLLMLCRTPEGLNEEVETAAKAVALGIPVRTLNAQQTAALDPDVEMTVAGSVYFPMDCHLHPARLMAVLQRELDTMDVRFLWESEVTGWLSEPGQVGGVRLSGERTVAADDYVICGGSWSPSMISPLGLKIPMQAGKGYSLTLPLPRQSPQICAVLTEARVAVTPLGPSLRFGGTLEIAGLNERINQRRVRAIINAVSSYYPAFTPDDFAGIQPWQGLRPCSPDGLPYIGRTSKFSNLILATGHAMMGISLAPVTGSLVAEIISGDQPRFDLSLFSPDRYSSKSK